MSRSGVEEKIPWRQVPKPVRQQIEDRLGAPVRRAQRIWGGYSPAPTFRLALADGQRAFFKAINASSNEFSTNSLRFEERVYQELGDVLEGWVARYYATVRHDDWHGLLLEDLGPKSVPPWTPAAARGVSHAMARFHRATLNATLPEWIARPAGRLAAESWGRVRERSEQFHKIAALVGETAPETLAWLELVSPTIERLMNSPVLATGPFSLLHGDLRSDNLRFRQGRLYLFDWPAITVGRAEWDIVVFAQSVTVEGGPLPEQVMAWYADEYPVDAAVVDSVLAWWFVFFADKAWRGEIPGLPRVRRFQRQQLGVLAQWAARRWTLTEPIWAAALLR